MADVTCGVPTKGRYSTLALTLLGVTLQTVKPERVIVIDDSDTPQDLRTLPEFRAVFELMNHYGIDSWIEYGRKLGQHYSHQRVQELSTTQWIWRIDDDEIPEPDVLEKLLKHTGADVGAVGGLVPQGPLTTNPQAKNAINDLSLPNVQWFLSSEDNGPVEVEHLHSTFIYRRGIVSYDLSLSPAAHREETIFTHELFRKGLKLLVDPAAITWHFRAGHGGIRSHQDAQYWIHDERIFNEKLKEWGVHGEPTKLIPLDLGRGDHVVFKALIPRLKAKYGKLVVASCFPDIFLDDDVEQISIAEAKQRTEIDFLNIYRWCIDHDWKGELIHAFEKMYEI